MIRTLLFTLLLLSVCSAWAQAPLANFTATPVAGCSPLVVNFTDTSTGNPTSWQWNFGNGATSTLKNPSTTYFLPGTYTVTLTVTNPSGTHTLTRQQFVTVYGKPLVAFSGSDSIGCYPYPVQFSDLSVASPGTTNTNWFWDLGDGAQSTSQNPQNTYLNSGNYTVSVKVTNDKGCWSVATKQAYIQINGGVTSDFTFQQPAVCRTPLTIQFANASSGPGILSYQWNFGDGGTSTQPAPSYTYNNPGVFTVTLITTSSSGCRDTMRKVNLFNFNNIITSFTAPDSVCVGQNVSFQNTSSSPANSSLWSFGDGSTSSFTSPVKAFATPGTYTVRLLQAYGVCTDSVSKTIKVKPKPTALFSASKTAFCQTPANVAFQSNATDAVSYLWSFGDGNTSTQQAPSHTYSAYGSYTVSLVVTSSNGCTDTLNKPGFIVVSKPVITFTNLPVKGCVPYNVNFNAAVSTPDPVVSYLWNFGNGTTSTEATPSYTYTAQGTYAVTLTVTTAGGCTETFTLQEAVKVGTKPNVNFSAVPNPVCAFQPVSFTNLTTGGGTEYQWIFGDGGTSTDKDPRHEYSDTGVFNVTLIVTNNGCRDSLRIDSLIRVKPPIAQFTYANTCANKLRVTFRDTSLGATSWFWQFGDGTTSTQRHPVHTYPAYGLYTVKLTVSNDTCTHTKTVLLNLQKGMPDFAALPRAACKGALVTFTADTTNQANIVQYIWNFGDGTFGAGRTTTHAYNVSGTYRVSLTTTDVTGCIDSLVKPDYIRINGPTANFTSINNNGCKGLTATFNNTSQSDGFSNIISWQWNLGDTTVVNSTPASVQRTYFTSGAFPISLKVTDAGGCVDSMVRPALVNVSLIKANFTSEDTLSCPGAAIGFTNTSVSSTSFTSAWDFGNGLTSTQNTPTTSYAADGQYDVLLTIVDALGCTDSLRRKKYITIIHPEASYTISDSSGFCTPFQVRFTNTSTNYISYIWDLGGGTSTIANPTQFYNQAGNYTTRLIVTSAGGCTDTASKEITVYDINNAFLNYLPLSGCKPLTVDLSAFSPAPGMNYIWDFGDGTITSSRDTIEQHVYNFFGDFVPKVIMQDASGCIVPVTGLDTIRIQGATTKFGLDKKLLCDSGRIQFIDSTTFNNPVSTYTWNFGDGTTSNLSSPSHYYNQPGIYPVTLNVLTQNNCVDTFRLSIPVTVVASPDVRIEGDSVICIGEGMNHSGAFNRTDTSVVQWAWNFPNGNTSAVQTPLRQVYQTAGNFVVQTSATNTSGCRDTVSKNIKVNPLPSVVLPAVITTRLGTPVLLPAVYQGSVITYNWTVPDGLSCTACPQPMSNPKFDTKYNVEFTDRNGCKNTGQVQVIVFCNNDNVFVPNTFSPNGDGSNDMFYVRGKGLNRVKSLRVFNRWGQIVFERNNFNVNDEAAGWNGTFNGAKAKPDVYVYQLEIWCDNSTVVKFDGNIALIQ